MKKASPSLAKAISLLELSKMELAEKIKENIMANSCLKEDSQLTINLSEDTTPDLVVEKEDGTYKVYANNYGIPRPVIIQPSGKDKEYKNALWFSRVLKRREKILLKVSKIIIDVQKDFLDRGNDHLKELSVEQVSEMCGFHASTVSRITKNKIISTPRGKLKLRNFIGNKVKVQRICLRIRKIIEKENPEKCLSDSEIADLLGKEGISINRRTVTKYRKLMNIGNYRERGKIQYG